ncbi:hypothetical protein CGCSCA1_v002146 [Colletotrichum siamense]|nr:hypothetical protein CGCSCA1_v002146 [Colletotrichum siamense]
MPDSRQAASPSLPASVPAATNTGPRRGVPESPRADQSNLHTHLQHLFGGGGGLRATATESYMGAMRMVVGNTPNFRHHNHIAGWSWFRHDDYHDVVLLLHGQSGVFTEKKSRGQSGRPGSVMRHRQLDTAGLANRYRRGGASASACVCGVRCAVCVWVKGKII